MGLHGVMVLTKGLLYIHVLGCVYGGVIMADINLSILQVLRPKCEGCCRMLQKSHFAGSFHLGGLLGLLKSHLPLKQAPLQECSGRATCLCCSTPRGSKYLKKGYLPRAIILIPNLKHLKCTMFGYFGPLGNGQYTLV